MLIQENNKKCFGCGACESICPNKAISLIEDKESFLYPLIDKKKCINCGLCNKTCPLTYDLFISKKEVTAYVGVCNSDDVIINSSSGGAFTALYEVFIEKGFDVFGVCFDKNLKVLYDVAFTTEECKKFRKSKYVQSYYNGCYERIANSLRDGRSVLFSGVSCQCAALILYLKAKGISDKRLVTVNVLCHGVPSQKLFDEYIKYMEKKEESTVTSYSFKNKLDYKGDFNPRTSMIEFENGHKMVKTIENDPFLRGYYRRLFIRPSCGLCLFAKPERFTDFTIADAWNIEKIKPEYNPLKGVSLVLFNTEKAREILGELHCKMRLDLINPEWVWTSQRLFHTPTDMHKNRTKFFELLYNTEFDKAVFKCTRPSLLKRIYSIIPMNIRKKIRKVLKGF